MKQTVEQQILAKLDGLARDQKKLQIAVKLAADEAVACHETVRQLPCRDGTGCPYRAAAERQLRVAGKRG